MAKISKDTASKLAKLARLAISSDQAAKIAVEIESILAYVEQLNEVSVDSLPEVSQVTGLKDVWREDIVVTSKLSQKDLFANAPEVEAGYIKVKRVL